MNRLERESLLTQGRFVAEALFLSFRLGHLSFILSVAYQRR